MRGPNTYQPSNPSFSINPSDLPNIDIGFNNHPSTNNNNYTNSQRSQPNNYSNRSYQNQPIDQPYNSKQNNQPQQGNGKGRVQFPSRINKPQQQQQQQQQQPQNSQRYIPSNIKTIRFSI
jgi:hypothetical protein